MSVPDATIGQAVATLRPRVGEGPFIGLVLGSGLGPLADALSDAQRIPYGDIPGFPPSGVAGHAGVLVAGRLEGARCLALQGRAHLYEGHPADAVAYPVRVLTRLGLTALIVTNAAGGVNPAFAPGTVMRIVDHINLQWRNPLIGAVQEGETRFPDMSAPYDARLGALAEAAARDIGVPLERGVYCAVTGPSYETPAEVRMLRRMGADAVGMSTVPEVLAARAAGVPVLGLSLVTNPGAGLRPEPLSHEEVVAAGDAAGASLARLMRAIVRAVASAEA